MLNYFRPGAPVQPWGVAMLPHQGDRDADPIKASAQGDGPVQPAAHPAPRDPGTLPEAPAAG